MQTFWRQTQVFAGWPLNIIKVKHEFIARQSLLKGPKNEVHLVCMQRRLIFCVMDECTKILVSYTRHGSCVRVFNRESRLKETLVDVDAGVRGELRLMHGSMPRDCDAGILLPVSAAAPRPGRNGIRHLLAEN